MAEENAEENAVGPVATPDLRVLALIIDEVDEARDVYDIVRQLQNSLPIKDFDALKRALGGRGMLTFRGSEHSVEPFRTLLPRVIFPIQDIESLVQLTANFVKLTPQSVRAR